MVLEKLIDDPSKV